MYNKIFLAIGGSYSKCAYTYMYTHIFVFHLSRYSVLLAYDLKKWCHFL